MSLQTALQKFLDDADQEEGFTSELLSFVDLDVAFSPVIAVRGETLDQSVEVVPTQGGKYIVRHPLFSSAVSANELRRMRLRWLLANQERMKRQYAPLLARSGSK